MCHAYIESTTALSDYVFNPYFGIMFNRFMVEYKTKSSHKIII